MTLGYTGTDDASVAKLEEIAATWRKPGRILRLCSLVGILRRGENGSYRKVRCPA